MDLSPMRYSQPQIYRSGLQTSTFHMCTKICLPSLFLFQLIRNQWLSDIPIHLLLQFWTLLRIVPDCSKFLVPLLRYRIPVERIHGFYLFDLPSSSNHGLLILAFHDICRSSAHHKLYIPFMPCSRGRNLRFLRCSFGVWWFLLWPPDIRQIAGRQLILQIMWCAESDAEPFLAQRKKGGTKNSSFAHTLLPLFDGIEQVRGTDSGLQSIWW